MSSTTSTNWLRSQIYGTLAITASIAIVIGALELYQTVVPSSVSTTNILNLGDGGWTGVFVVWLVLVLLFSLVNGIVHGAKSAK